MKQKKTSSKQKKYLFALNAKKIARNDEIVVYIIGPILALLSFLAHAKVIGNYLYYDKVTRFDIINLYTHYKVFFLALLMGILMCYIVYRMFMYEVTPSIDYITIGIGLIVISAIISTIMSPVRENYWWGSYEKGNGLLAYLSLYLLTFIISQLCISKKSLKYIIVIINIVVIGMCVIGIFQFFGHNIAESKFFESIVTPKGIKLTLSTSKLPFSNTGYFKVESMLQNTNYFGAFCIIYFPFIFVMALKEKSILLKLFYYIGVILTVSGIVMAQAFASIITLVIIFPILVIVAVNKKNVLEFGLITAFISGLIYMINKATQNQALKEVMDLFNSIIGNKKVKVLIISIVIVWLITVLIRPYLKRYIRNIIKIISIVSVMVGATVFIIFLKTVVPANKYIFSQRGYIWHYTQDVIKVNPVFGVGPDKYYYEFPQDVEGDLYQTSVVIDRPHNMYLQYITDIGSVGFVGFLILLIGLVWKSADKLINEEEDEINAFLSGILLLIIAYFIQGFANDNMVAIQITLWPLLAVAMSISNSSKIKEITEKCGTFNK